MREKKEKIKKLTLEFLQKLGQKGEVVVEENKEDQVVKVEIKTDDPTTLIGFHGKTLSSFQLILGLMVYRLLEKWQRVVVDVNDYREKRDERLRQMALNVAQKVKFSGQSVALLPMSPFERRIIHLALTEFSGVETTSEGEGDRRHVVINPSSSKKEK